MNTKVCPTSPFSRRTCCLTKRFGGALEDTTSCEITSLFSSARGFASLCSEQEQLRWTPPENLFICESSICAAIRFAIRCWLIHYPSSIIAAYMSCRHVFVAIWSTGKRRRYDTLNALSVANSNAQTHYRATRSSLNSYLTLRQLALLMCTCKADSDNSFVTRYHGVELLRIPASKLSSMLASDSHAEMKQKM